MNLKKVIIAISCLFAGTFLTAQEVTGIQADIRAMTKETDPEKAIVIKDRIIKEYDLDTLKDSETMDMLNGNVALAFVMKKNYKEFEKYIGKIKNRFNQTSMLNMAANKLLAEDIDANYANKIAVKTLEEYYSFKDDPNARPDSYTLENWERFITFSKYPYYDTYAKSLFALKRYKEALQYQRMTFQGEPEEGLPVSVERYAKLLELNGEKESAKQLLLKIAGKGKLNKGMIAQLESFYVSERGNNAGFDAYMDSLQNNKAELIKDLRTKMINEPAPPFTLKDLSGKQVSLSDYKGKIVILDLWATWCVPCIKSFPAMQKQVKKHPDVAFLFIAVQETGDNIPEKVKNFMDKKNYSFHVLLDEPVAKGSEKYKIVSAYKPNGIPAKYFIDKKGKLRFRSKGFDTDQELMNEIDAMITIMKTL
ncbi:TlpA family protein disulfide reductase [Sinomicrobium kalidii]|uniref:TlpA family protein disulfide reductase n=1 Tax=Sinomicrobium kalidii TaxID=2900738 RepID=UPI001E3BC061|nr:TlpA disulfide reductase family protein [Sinomicrobium kalidii]UGU15474.1 TlpA family protein disulfide reductase [Sinomicrobium kalidii]